MGTGLKINGQQLSLPGFRATPCGLIANKGLTKEQWEEAGHTLFTIEERLAWFIGDWLAAMKGEEWGYGDLATVCEENGWNYSTARTYKSVCATIELSSRLDNLSFSHHQEAQGPDQDELLRWASENEASVADLRREKKRRREKQPSADETETEKPEVPCPNCAGRRWKDGACAKCGQLWGEPTGGVDSDRLKEQRAKTVKTVEALMRAFDDLHLLSPCVLLDGALDQCRALIALAKRWGD